MCLEEMCIVLAIATNLLQADPCACATTQPHLGAAHMLFDSSIFKPQDPDPSAPVTLDATVLLLWMVRICPTVLDVTRDTGHGSTTLLAEMLASQRITRECFSLLLQASNYHPPDSIMPVQIGLSAAPQTAAPLPLPKPVTAKTVPDFASVQKELTALKQMQRNMGSILVALNEQMQKKK